MQINWSETRKKFPLSQKKIIKKTIGTSIGYSILFFFIFVSILIPALSTSKTYPNSNALAILGIAFFIFLGLEFLVLIIAYLYQQWYFAVYYYDLTPDYIVIKKGPITPREITIPYERVQDVYVDQDLLDRIFNIYDIHLSSATVSSGMEAHIDGVEKAAADGLREMLLTTVKAKISAKKAQ